MPARHHHQLPNGLRVVTTEQGHLHGVCVALAVRCGGRDDTTRKWGLAHFLEHMLFRGSAAYADAAALIAPFEQGGGTLNAETWRDHTIFWAVVHPRHLAQVMTALADMMARPSFNDLSLERSLVHAELDGDIDEDGQDTDIGNLSRGNIWRGHPLGRRIVGSDASLTGLTKRDLRRLHARAYVGTNMALSVAGRVTHDEVVALAQAHFACVAAGKPLPLGPAPVFAAGGLDVYPQPTSQSTLQLTFEALPDGHVDFAALSLLVGLLDDGMGTRLHRALSEKSGLVYDFQTGLDCYWDCGVYDVEMQVAPGRLPAALNVTLGVLKDVAMGDVDEAELRHVQQRALMALELGQDSAEDVAQEAAVDVLFGRPGPERYREALAACTREDIERLARHMFLQAPRRMTLMGPADGVDSAHLARLFEQLRAPQSNAAVNVVERARARSCR